MRFPETMLASGAALSTCAALTLGGGGCAYNATGTAPPKQLIFEFSVEGESLLQSQNWAYYLVIDTNGRPDDGPLINGPAPQQQPYPDPRSYLPFVRDESAFLDRETLPVPNTYWSTYFALYEENGQFVVWQGRPLPDGTINERDRPLQKGREWGILNNKTLQLNLPFTLIRDPGVPAEADDPPQWEANLAVAKRGSGGFSRDFTIERWGQVQNTFFAIQTRPINQNFYDSVAGVTFPQNLPGGVDPRNMNIVTVTYRVVAEGSKRK